MTTDFSTAPWKKSLHASQTEFQTLPPSYACRRRGRGGNDESSRRYYDEATKAATPAPSIIKTLSAMFSIYGVTGQVFSGTLEEMLRIRALSRVKAGRAIGEDGDESVVEGNSVRRRDDAVLAYRAMLPQQLERGPLYQANQIMQRRVVTVSADDAVATAWRILRANTIHQAPVLELKAQLVGIVSERDLLTALNVDADLIVESLNRQVRDVMSTPVVTAAPVTDIRRIASVMLEYGVDGVPIINEMGQIVGFVSRGDVLRAVVADPPLSLWR